MKPKPLNHQTFKSLAVETLRKFELLPFATRESALLVFCTKAKASISAQNLKSLEALLLACVPAAARVKIHHMSPDQRPWLLGCIDAIEGFDSEKGTPDGSRQAPPCSFCGRSHEDVAGAFLTSGGTFAACSECVNELFHLTGEAFELERPSVGCFGCGKQGVLRTRGREGGVCAECIRLLWKINEDKRGQFAAESQGGDSSDDIE